MTRSWTQPKTWRTIAWPFVVAVASACAVTTGSDAGAVGPIQTRAAGAESVVVARSTDDYGPIASPSLPSSVVEISPGDDVQAVLNDHPAGTAFFLRSGRYREATLRLDPGDVLIGEMGAVLDGSRVVTGFRQEDGRWVMLGPERGIAQPDDECAQDGTFCGRPEQLFIDGAFVPRVERLDDLVPGTWYLDDASDLIWVAEDVRDRTVELSVTPVAVVGAASAIVRNVVVEKYATRANGAAVRLAPDMVLERSEIRLNASVGVTLADGDGAVLRANRFMRNGRAGIVGSRLSDVLIEGNEIAFNNTHGYEVNGSGAGTKLVATVGATIRRNYVHDNLATGLWTDYANRNLLVEGNLVTDNLGRGIHQELGGSAVIRDNTVRGSGDHGIYVADSFAVLVHSNVLAGNRSGLVARTNCRNNREPDSEYVVRNVEFFGNTVRQAGEDAGWPRGKAASLSLAGDCELLAHVPFDAYHVSWGNRFHGNRYELLDGADFFWFGTEVDAAAWREYGQDVAGSFVDVEVE